MRTANITMMITITTLVLCSAPAAAQCTKDIDCKGIRLCEAGRCVSPFPVAQRPTYSFAPEPSVAAAPASSVAPAPATPTAPAAEIAKPGAPARREWLRGYASVAPIILPKGSSTAWGRVGDDWIDSELDMETAEGFQLAGRYAVRRGFHIGGFFGYYSEADIGSISAGVSIKVGGPVSSRVFLSGVIDFGYCTRAIEADQPFQGFVLAPRFQVDVMTVRAGGFKWALFAAQGIEVVPYASTGWFTFLGEEAKLSFASIRPYLLLGTTFGG